MNKYIIPLMISLLLLSTSFTGISSHNKITELKEPVKSVDGQMDSPWPMFGHDARHTGRSSYSTESNFGGLKWIFEADWMFDSSPVMDNNGTIYIASWNYLYAVYLNGTQKWCWQNNEIESSSPALADDGAIYIGGNDGNLHALYPNGTKKWGFHVSDSIKGAITVGPDGTIYFGTFDRNGVFYAINPDGTEKWHYDADFFVQSTPAIGSDGTIYFASHVYLYSFTPNGTLNWNIKLGDQNFVFLGGPSIGDDGTIYIPRGPGPLYAINPNGTIKWTCDIEWGSCKTPSIGQDGTIYIGYKGFHAVNPDGTNKWSFYPDDYDWHCIDSRTFAISDDGTVYIATERDSREGYLIAINPDGTEKWRHWITNERALSSPIIGPDGTVYIGAHLEASGYPYGLLYAFNGKQFKEPTIEKPKHGKLYFLNSEKRSTIFGNTLIIGKISIEVDHPDINNVSRVDFYIDNEKLFNDTDPPFQWTWDHFSFSKHTIKVTATNVTGREKSTALEVWKFF